MCTALQMHAGKKRILLIAIDWDVNASIGVLGTLPVKVRVNQWVSLRRVALVPLQGLDLDT